MIYNHALDAVGAAFFGPSPVVPMLVLLGFCMHHRVVCTGLRSSLHPSIAATKPLVGAYVLLSAVHGISDDGDSEQQRRINPSTTVHLLPSQ